MNKKIVAILLACCIFIPCIAMEKEEPPSAIKKSFNFIKSSTGAALTITSLYFVTQLIFRCTSSNETIELLYDVGNAGIICLAWGAWHAGSEVAQHLGHMIGKKLPREIRIDQHKAAEFVDNLFDLKKLERESHNYPIVSLSTDSSEE